MYDRSADTNAKTRDTLPTREFSVATEFAGVTRHAAARAVARALTGRVRKGVEGSSTYYVDCPATGTWAVTPLTPGEAWESRGGALTSPPMRLPALGVFGPVHAELLTAGAAFDAACGMSVTVRVPGITVGQLSSLLTLEANGAPLVAEMLGDRSRWIAPTPGDAALALRRAARAGATFDTPAVADVLRSALPPDGAITVTRLNGQPELVTYRALRATTDPVEFAAAVHVALGLVARAVTVAEARPGTGWRRFGEGAKWAAVQFWYIMHGLVGAEFAATRALFRARVRAAHPIDHSDPRPMDTWAPSTPPPAHNPGV